MVRSLARLGAALAAAASVLAVSSVFAGSGTQPEAVVALHAKPHRPPSPETPCDVGKPAVSCREYRVTWPIESSADVYLVVARGYPDPGIAGVSCGISYDATVGTGVDVFDWTLCADLDFRNAGDHGEWPASGGGDRITWVSTTNCQRTVIAPDGVHAIAGAFYVYAYSSDALVLTPNNNIDPVGEFAVADCAAKVTYLQYDWELAPPGRIGFGSEWGVTPCWGKAPIPVRRTTWGELKTKY